MFNTSDSLITTSLALIAAGVLIWGYRRAKPFGKIGLLAWLQSVVLMVPWFVFFGLLAAGIYLSLVGIILLLVTSAGVYIYLGNRLRAEGQDKILRDRAAQRIQEQEANDFRAATTDENAIAESDTESDAEPADGEIVPSTMLPIPDDDLQQIKGIFGIDTFFSTETISYQEGAIFKGNLRGEPADVHTRLSTKLEERLGDQYRLFLVEGPEKRPVVIVLPSSDDPPTSTLAQKNLAIVLLVATLATTLESASLLLGFDWFSELGRYGEALPIAAGLWLILAAHELGHIVLAKRYNLRLSWPFLLPSWQIGTFGAITRFESLLPNRFALFDVSLAGPAAGGILSLLMLAFGLILSHPGSLFQVPAEFFQGSILVGTLAKVVLGDALRQSIVDVHPLTVVGWLGLTITALNLMPAGQLDGGRIVQAIYGRRTVGRTTVATLIVLGIVALLTPNNPIPIYWAIAIFFLQRGRERPSLNELTEPDDMRAALGLLALFLMLATLIPLSPALAGRLGIGV